MLHPPQDLYEIGKNSTFIDLDCDSGSETLAITTEKSIVLLKAKDNNVIRVWTCKRGQKHTTAALYAVKEGEYVAVLNEKLLKMLKDDHSESSQTFTVKTKIHRLVKCPSMNPLVMLHDGSVYHLQQALKDPATIVPDINIDFKAEDFLFTASFPFEENAVIVCSICYINQKCNLLISVINESEVKHFTEVLKIEDMAIKAATSFPGSKIPSFATVLSDGTLCLNRVNVNNKEKVVVTPIRKLEIDDNVSLTYVSEDQVAVLCKGPSILIVDLKFGSIVCETSVHDQVCQISSLGNMIIILRKSGLLQKMIYNTQLVTLANVTLKQNRQLQSTFQSGKWSLKSDQKFLLNSEDLDTFSALIETKQEEVFNQSWKHLWVTKPPEYQRAVCSSDMMRKLLVKFGVKRSELPFWPHSMISEVVRTGLVNARWCQGLMQSCLEESNWSLLHECFLHLKDIPESVIVSCLKHFAKNLMEDHTVEVNEDKTPQHSTSCLNQLFLLPYSENTMRKELMSLPFESAMIIIHHLTAKMKEFSVFTFPPMAQQVQNWLSLLLDTHVTQFIMLDKSWNTINDLHEEVKVQSLLYEELTTVNKLLSQIELGTLPLKPAKNVPYFVQVLEI